MKLKLLSFLLILLVLAACRNDHLQDLHYQEEGAKNQLVSKIISLNESVHKHKLLPQLKAAKENIKKTMPKNKFGKMVSFGDSISIDTDQVIYIENGPNYHTYTFAIERTNPSPNDPIENLLLTPLPDGTYKEFLVIYNFTEQEKENISNGNYSYSGSNTTITELASGTFNASGTLARQFCGWETRTGWNPCSSSDHDGSNFHECAFLNNLSAGTPPTTYTYSVYVCPQDETIAPSDPPESGGGGGGGSLDPPCETCPPHTPVECIEVPTDPTQPSTGIGDDGGCIIGIPTLPNLPNPKNNPCAKIRAAFADEKFKAKFDILTDPAVFDEDHETAFVMKHPPIGTTGVAPAFISIDMPPCSTGDSDAVWPNNFAGITVIMHNHNNEDCNGNTPVKAPSPVDIRTFINKLLPQANTFTGSYTGAMSLVTTSGGNYMLMYEGTNYPGSINAIELKKLNDEYKRDFQILYQRKANVTQSDIEKVFTRFLKEKLNKLGLGVYRVTKTSAVKIEYDPASPNSVKETACP